MNNFAKSFIILFALILSAFTQKDELNKLKKDITEIDKFKNYQKIIFNNEEFMMEMTDGGGTLTGYFKDGNLLKIEEEIYLSHCKITSQYYFKDGKLFFAVRRGFDETTESNKQKHLDWSFFVISGKFVEQKAINSTVCTGEAPDQWCQKMKNLAEDYYLRLTN